MRNLKMQGRHYIPDYELKERAIFYCNELGLTFVSMGVSDEGFSCATVNIIDSKGREKILSMQSLYSRYYTKNKSKPANEINTNVRFGKEDSVSKKLLVNKWKNIAESLGYIFVELVEGSIELSGSKAMLVSKRTKMSYVMSYEDLI